MRVIAGEFRSRILKGVPGTGVRPTPDRLREALFNILTPQLEDAVFADLYAGTGAVGIEALSRGARKVILVEQNRAAIRVIHENLHSLGIEARAAVVQAKAAVAIAGLEADIVFLDPPYELAPEYEAALARLGSQGFALVVAQHSRRLELREEYGRLRATRVLKQGDNVLSFYAT